MPSPHLYSLEGRRKGIDPELLQRAANYQKGVRSNGAVPVLTLRHLSVQTDCSYHYLRQIVRHSLDPYARIERRKRDGSTRTIYSPAPTLMGVQRWLLTNVLTGLTIHDRAFAYRKQRSATECAREHVGAQWLVKMDLHDFFGTIQESRVYDVLYAMGYPKLISFEMTRICTRPRLSLPLRTGAEGKGIEAYGSRLRGVLPQGAPTSGALANAVAFGLDERLEALALHYNLVYTRYSDDITLSSADAFDRRVGSKIIRDVTKAASLEGFQVHAGKTRLVPPGARHIVLGLVLHGDTVRLRPEFRRQVENHVRCVEKFGPAKHASHRGFDSAMSMINYVDGCLAYGVSVEPIWVESLQNRWNHALESHGHPPLQQHNQHRP